MIDKQWLQSVKDGRRIIAQLDKDIWQVPDAEDRDILVRLFKDARQMFDYCVGEAPDGVGERYGRLLEIANLVNELR